MGLTSIEPANSLTLTVEATDPAGDLASSSPETITATDVVMVDIPTVAPTAPAVNDLASQPTKVARVLVPTPTPTAAPTEEPAQEVSSLPQVRIIPAVGIKLPPTRTPTPSAFAPTPTPTLEPLPPIAPGRLWSTFAPNIGADYDHFWVGRPFLPDAPTQLASPSYQFGSTAGDRYRPHHGMDISNPFGTPVLAATEGEVVHAGPDDVEMLGPYNNFYGNTVVIRLARRLTVGDGQLDVYLLYGHLSQVFTAVGQQVQPGDVVGAVGMTGIAIGPHLHVEMRLGANTYRHSVNPYLWVQSPGDTGAVAVRLLTADGRTWPGARLTLARFEGGRATWARMIETYLDTENIGPDPTWGENGAMDGAPPGSYVIVGAVNGERIRAELTVNAGQTTFVEIRTQQ
jgi:murein DD-endopeptidase MepM/ murein hydrolase activator NlpD